MDSSPYSTLQNCLSLCQFGKINNNFFKKSNSKQTKEGQNDKHLSRGCLQSKCPHATGMVSGLISGSEHIKALTQHPTLTSKPNEAQILQQPAVEAGCLEAAFLEANTSSAAAEILGAWSDVSTSSPM